MKHSTVRKIVIVGGGAAGFFAALAAAERALNERAAVDICILESSDSLLKKVKISGGGRCNVTHNCFDVPKFCENYPRGNRELISMMTRFQARDTVAWFAARGVSLVAESDGRMFPDTDSSQTIIDCFLREAERLKVRILKNHVVEAVSVVGGNGAGVAHVGADADSGTRTNLRPRFCVKLKDQPDMLAHSVLIATGSSPAGYRFAKELGHTISELAPSLFSFKISNPILHDLSGTSFSAAGLTLNVEDQTFSQSRLRVFKQQGPLLITHWGLSGPAILKLSAWAAREMKHADYKATLKVNWLGAHNHETVVNQLREIKSKNSKSLVGNVYPDQLSKRFWQRVLEVVAAGVVADKKWADLSNSELSLLAETLFAYELQVLGKNRFKDEFVECGGVNLKEINLKTMESKIHPGLFFAGELLDIDGITGGFNFQNAWTGGWIAAQNM